MKALLFSLFLFHTAAANDSLVMSSLLKRIDVLQPKSAGVFPQGSIPSYRTYALNSEMGKADINAFFTGLVAFTLRDIRSQLTASQQRLAGSIIDQTLPVYQKFRNTKGRNTYNFWPTDTPQVFPNAGWLNWFDKSQALPDDLDDTVIMLLAMNAPDSVAREVHKLMQLYTNHADKQIRNTFKDYRAIGAYSTWFGEKMPVDFDICVLSNVLYFVQSYGLEWTKADSASLELIEKIITDKRHLTHASYVAPHYSKLPIILYHLSRLMSVRPIPALEKHRAVLIEQTKEALAKVDNFMDEVIMGTALMRWGVAPPPGKPREAGSLEELVENDEFSFFIANMASLLPGAMKQWMGGAGVGKFYYYCPAYNNVLLLENLAWRRKLSL